MTAITRDLDQISALSGDDFCDWRAAARTHLQHHEDPALSAVYAATTSMLCDRAELAWQQAKAAKQ